MFVNGKKFTQFDKLHAEGGGYQCIHFDILDILAATIDVVVGSSKGSLHKKTEIILDDLDQILNDRI